MDKRVSLKDHDYCQEAFNVSQRPPTPPPAPAKIVRATKPLPPVRAAEDLSEMDKIANDVAMGASFDNLDDGKKKHKKRKDKKKRKKKKHRKGKERGDSSSRFLHFSFYFLF